MEKHVIVTGANGYLGFYVCKELLDQGYQIIAFKFSHFASQIIQHRKIQYHTVDITESLSNNRKLLDVVSNKNITAIINLAALLGSSDYDKNYSVNAQGVNNLMDFAKEVNVNRFIQISSVVILKKIKGPYGETKLLGQEFLTKSGLDYTVFIPAMIMGPESLGLNRVLKNVFRIPFIVPLIGNGQQTQHPIFVKDFAKYIVKSIDEPKSYKKVYEIAGDTVISFKEFISAILKIKDKKKIFISLPPWFAKLLGLFFQKTQKVPLFTAEHVKGVLQDSNLNTDQISMDLDFKPTPFTESLKFCIDKIGTDWDYYLNTREEKLSKVDSKNN